jgi:hypothetical protein
MALNQDDIEKKFALYDDRHYFWRDKILTQLGYSINLFLTLGIAILGFAISEKGKFPVEKIKWEYSINYLYISYVISITLLFYSILTGCISVASRLFDLRITSHTFKIRKNTVEKLGRLLPPESPEKDNYRLWSFIKITFNKDFISVKEADYNDYENVKKKFNHNRDLTRKLGELTWSTHKQQIACLSVAIIIYGILMFVR